jgi:hypothetical protein
MIYLKNRQGGTTSALHYWLDYRTPLHAGNWKKLSDNNNAGLIQPTKYYSLTRVS